MVREDSPFLDPGPALPSVLVTFFSIGAFPLKKYTMERSVFSRDLWGLEWSALHWGRLGLFGEMVCLVYLPASLFYGFLSRLLVGSLSVTFWTVEEVALLFWNSWHSFRCQKNSKSPCFKSYFCLLHLKFYCKKDMHLKLAHFIF